MIYIVTGTTGEYSDRAEWPVCYFATEQEAKGYIEILQTQCAQHSWDRLENDEKAYAEMRRYDPGFFYDRFTGTRWFVSPCPSGSNLPTPA